MFATGSSDAWRHYRRKRMRRAWRRTIAVRAGAALAAAGLAGSCTLPSAQSSAVARIAAPPLAPRIAPVKIVPDDAEVAAVEPVAAFSNMTPDVAPDLPAAPAPAVTWDAGPAALPFNLSGQSPVARMRAHLCLATAIYYEADSESDDGERAVAQVVLNRVRHAAFPASICGVVYQGSENPNHCQFTFACDGSMLRHTVSVHGWARASRIADAALAGEVFKPVGLAINYHTLAVAPRWSPLLVPATVVGAHIFYRLQGPAGAPGVFAQRYARIEPVPGPHTPLVAPAPQPTALAFALPIPAVPRTPPAPISSAEPGTVEALPPPITPADQILPRWRDSGTLIKR